MERVAIPSIATVAVIGFADNVSHSLKSSQARRKVTDARIARLPERTVTLAPLPLQQVEYLRTPPLTATLVNVRVGRSVSRCGF